MKITDVFTLNEAAELWNVKKDTLKQICIGRFKGFYEHEARKSGTMWLVTREGMERLYGKITQDK